MKNIKLPGKPKSSSSLYRNQGQRRFLTTKGKELKHQYQWEAKAQWPHQPLEGNDISVSVVLYFQKETKVKRDVENYFKIPLDALTGIVWHDDSQIKELSIIREYDPGEPRIEIIIAA